MTKPLAAARAATTAIAARGELAAATIATSRTLAPWVAR